MKLKLLYLLLFFIPVSVFGSIYRQSTNYYNFNIPDRNAAHFYALPYQLNPALTGSQNTGVNALGRVVVNHRFQPNELNSTQLGYDQYCSALKGGLGLISTRDFSTYGITHSTVNASYARVIPVTDKFYLRTGLQMSIGEKRINHDVILFYNEPLPADRVTYPNIAAGIVGYTNQFFVGFAVHNILEPVQSFYGTEDGIIHRRYTLHGGWEMPLSKKENSFILTPNMILMSQYNQNSINLGAYLNKGILVTGMWLHQSYGEFQTSDALMVLMGIQTERFRVGYSFDIAVSSARRISNGAHEITIAYNLFQNKEEGSALARRVPYPAF
jgi:type IX secretion system PorP/SprF family membrane protein